MPNSASKCEIVLVLDVVRDPSNEIVECHYYSENCLYLSVKGRPEISFLLHIPITYPVQELTICQLTNGIALGDVIKSPLNIIDTVLMIIAIVSNEFKKPMPNSAAKLNPELYQQWLFDFNNVAHFKSSLSW
ncbi:unnamed protein product [Hymenolepis diminuta]|uniref:RWD domain-containing protein n=1 Tax=Hymenolepis diminuta TaxID=6216 RepID=A0A564XW01_HYMDI|nr:unnamed protein product [Hymenolepis diminuta]